MSLAHGSRFGAYEIQGLLGAGGMGEVYRARDPRLQRDVALKILPTKGATDPERLSRFAREAQILAALNHPNVGAIYGLEQGPDQSALVLELVDGRTLAEVVAESRLPVSEALRIAREIAAAVQAARARGIVHRDLKPANVKLTSSGQVKVLDFGLAKVFEPNAPGSDAPTVAGVTQAGVVIGTPAYMAPEQARGLPTGKAADVWAFGCLLYELLSGHRAFGGTTVSDTIAAVLTAPIELQRLPPETPRSVRRVLRRCLERDVEKRLRDLGDACLDLQEDDDHEAIYAARGRPTVRSFVAASLLSGLAMTAAVVSVWALWPRPPAAAPPLRKFELAIAGLSAAPVAYPEISPDGEQLALIAGGKLWVRELSTLGSRVVLDDSPILFFWSPDGRQIGFALGDKLMRVSADGGEPLTLATLPGNFGSQGWGGTWTRDGRIVLAQADGRSPLLEVPETGGTLRPILERHKGGDYHEPEALPNGKGLLYGVHAGRVEVIEAFDGTSARGAAHQRRGPALPYLLADRSPVVRTHDHVEGNLGGAVRCGYLERHR